MWKLAAIVWGFAEATLFFFVPDVLLTRAALVLGWRRALFLCCLSALAAVFGGALMYQWGARDPALALTVLDHVPGISPGLIDQVHSRLEERWPQAMMLGGIQGQPFKIFAVILGQSGIAWGSVLPVAFIARLTRFALLSTTAILLKKALGLVIKSKKTLMLTCFALWAVTWTAIYIIYFAIFGF